MTTAARPTYEPAKGGSGMREKSVSKLSELVSSRDLKGHTTLKERRLGQGTTKELLNKDFKAALEEGERLGRLEDESEAKRRFVPSLEQATQMKLALKAEELRAKGQQKEASLLGSSVIGEDKQNYDSDETPRHARREPIDIRRLAQLDNDEDFGDFDGDNEDDLASDFDVESDDMSRDEREDDIESNNGNGNDDDDDDDDDPAELMAELKRIRQERAAEEERMRKERGDTFAAPNMSSDDTSECSFSLKRRWDDDVPFKNCAREDPSINKRRFLNDTVRRDFHKKFLNKYIR